MYRVCALASFGLSFLLLVTDASMTYAVSASAFVPLPMPIISLPSAFALVLATVGRKILTCEKAAIVASAQNYYAPLVRMVQVFEAKDREEQCLALGL